MESATFRSRARNLFLSRGAVAGRKISLRFVVCGAMPPVEREQSTVKRLEVGECSFLPLPGLCDFPGLSVPSGARSFMHLCI